MVHHSSEIEPKFVEPDLKVRVRIFILAALFLNGWSRPTLSETVSPANPDVQKWCSDLVDATLRMKWKITPCKAGIEWKKGGESFQKRSLMYTEFGDPRSENVTLIFSMVHGDENTPLYLGIELANWMHEHQASFKNHRIVIAPLVNPDGFFKTPRTRMNARGVDLNRNFSTYDWKSRALKSWKTKYRSDPRRFPGSTPSSEPETLFQEKLIRQMKPQKILSIHAPLNMMDYDGPNGLALARFSREYVKKCLTLRQRLRAISSGFFPGSLGNYAGQELGIPTLTLELPSGDFTKAETYWKSFSQGIQLMIEFEVPKYSPGNPIKPAQTIDG